MDTEDRSQPPPSSRARILAEVASLGPAPVHPPHEIVLRRAPLPEGWDPADSSTAPDLAHRADPEGRLLRANRRLDQAAKHLELLAAEHDAPGAAAAAVLVRGLSVALPGIPLGAADFGPQTLRSGEPPPSGRR